MSDSDGSPTSSPPAPPADSASPPESSSESSAPPPTDSTSPPADSSQPPPSSDSEPSPPPPPPPDSVLPSLPWILTPLTDTPPPDSNSPPEESNNPQPPPTSTESPSPPADSETPPAPPNDPPPSSDVHPPPSPSSSSTNHPETPPSQSPSTTPLAPTDSPPAPPSSDPTKPLPVQPSAPANSPPAAGESSFLAPPKPNGGSGGAVVSPSLTAPSKVTPPTNGSNGGISSQGKIMVGVAVAGGFAIMALIAVVFLLRRKKKRNIDNYSHSQYLPHPNFSVKSDGFSYGQDPSKVYSGPGGGSMCNSQQQHSSMGNSYGSQTGHQMQSNSIPESAILGTNQTHFSYQELADITQGFARHNVLGEGGFGCVYKGTLHDGKVVAVKQLKAGSGQGDREFTAEVEIISRVHHRHLVSLVGYCISDQHRLLIYEYVANQTLEHHLHGKGMPVLEWSKRVRIAIGSAKGLAYLHEDCKWYLAPEYASSGKLTDRSDVFSFGVVLLELVTGRKPVDQNQPLGEESLVEWVTMNQSSNLFSVTIKDGLFFTHALLIHMNSQARPLLLRAIETGDYSELIDRRLEKHYVEHEVVRMIETAAACVRHSGPKRPRMAQVVRALDCDEDSGNISNGIKVGQSTTYDSGQYNQEIMKFRKMAFGIDDSTESGMNSGGYSGKSSSDFSGNESETRPFNNRQF
ncbi:hypothetical protein Bca101_066741 [Brassica carinata]